METRPMVHKVLETVLNVGRFVLYRLDGAHGGWADLGHTETPVTPASIQHYRTPDNIILGDE